MNITLKEKLNIYDKVKPPVSRIPFSEHMSSVSPFNNLEERPLKTNSQNLSFEGLSSIKVSHAMKEFASEFGETAAQGFHNRIIKADSIKGSGLKLDGDSITFSEQPFSKRFLDVVLYPVTKMPLDLVNSTVYGIKRMTGNREALSSISEIKVLKDRRNYVESLSDAASAESYFNAVKEGKKVFVDAHKRFDPNIADYNGTSERVLTRIVTGSIPAFYLANDAYNLSTFMNDNKDMAKAEKKRRFNQEIARVGITAASTFAVLTLFSKKSNSSEKMTVFLMSALTLASEIIGRMAAGTPILPVGEKGAKYYAKKQGKATEGNNNNKTPMKNFEAKMKKDQRDPNAPPPEKGKITFKNILKVAGLLVAAGFGIEKASNIASVKKLLNTLNGKYKSLYTEEATISRSEFNKITAKLKENGFDKIADRYQDMIKYRLGDTINLGEAKNKAKFTIIHQILAFPVRFAWDTLMMPYKQIVKPIVNTAFKSAKKLAKVEEKPSELAKAKANFEKNNKILQNSLKFLKKIENKPDYKERVCEGIISSLDDATKSSYSSAGLAPTIRVATNAVTSAFLIADNYNLVMIDSQGQDKDLAEQKAKERLLQRVVKIIYGAFAIKLFNGVFSHTYNGSLLGAQAVNAANTIISENIERTSVGLPTKEASREEIIENERKNLKAKGLKGAYFRFMAELTGKKPISEVKKKEKKDK